MASIPLLLGCSNEVSHHVVNFPMERHTWQGTEEDLQPTARKELRLSPITSEKLNPVKLT